MTPFLQLLLGFALTASAAILVALALSHILRQRASARSAYIAWLAVLLAVLIPFRPLSPARTQVTLPAQPVSRTAERMLYTPKASAPQAVQNTAPAAAYRAYTGASYEERQTVSPAPAKTVIARPALTWGTALLTLYLAGAAVSLALQLGRHLRYMRLIRRWRRPPQADTQAVYQEVCREMNLRYTPPLYVCRAVDTPMVAGVARPCVLLPDEALDLPELRLIFRHELTHYRRGDLPAKCLMMAACSLHWYNPLIYWMRREMEYACEAACDESVMRGQDMDMRAYYSETIVAVIRRQNRRRTALSTTFYGGKKGMKNRILSIMNTSRRLGALLLCPVLLVTMIFSVAFAGEPAGTHEPQEAADSLQTLFREEGEYITQEAAEEAAIQLYRQVREADGSAPYKADSITPVGFAIKDVTYGNSVYENAVVDLLCTFTASDGSKQEGTYRAYLTPRGGVPVSLHGVWDWGEDAWGYWHHDLLNANSESRALESSLPRKALINNALAASANLCQGTTDYDWPEGTLLNGAEVTVLQLEVFGNNIQMLTNAQVVYWARVQVGPEEKAGGAVGWIPLLAMTFADEMIGSAASLPTAAVTGAGPTGHVNLYGGCDAQSTVITTLPSGETVTLLGRFAEYWQVRCKTGEYGFLPLENVQLGEDEKALEASILPKNFDSYQPGFRISYEEYAAVLERFYEEYGDSNEWTLEQAAQVSQYRQSYPFDRDLPVNILPGEGDMTEEQAHAFALDYVEKTYGITPEDVMTFFESLTYEVETPETHLWRFRFNVRAGLKNCGVTFDQQGNIVADWQDKNTSRFYGPEGPDREEMMTRVDYYLSYGVTMGAAEVPGAEDLAWELYQKANPEAGSRENYTIKTEQFRDTYFDDNGPSDLTWYVVTVYPPTDGAAEALPWYRVALVGDQVYAEDARFYQEQMEDLRRRARLETLEAEYGGWITWTPQEKAERLADIWPGEFAVPDENVLPQGKAYSIACRALVEQAGFSAQEVSEWQPCFTYWNDGTGRYLWRVDFLNEEELNGGYNRGIFVWVDPVTGEVGDIGDGSGNG